MILKLVGQYSATAFTFPVWKKINQYLEKIKMNMDARMPVKQFLDPVPLLDENDQERACNRSLVLQMAFVKLWHIIEVCPRSSAAYHAWINVMEKVFILKNA